MARDSVPAEADRTASGLQSSHGKRLRGGGRRKAVQVAEATEEARGTRGTPSVNA
jgi:hypothetical protein